MEKRYLEFPFFSICIPQYNRTSFLLKALESMAKQKFKNFEICVSDGGSTDGRESEIIECLKMLNIDFIYEKKKERTHYDENLRNAISLSRGTFVFLCGNDDALKDESVLDMLYERILGKENLGVVISNYEDWNSGVINKRIIQTAFMTGGPFVAAGHFRNLSFVSGVLIHRLEALRFETNKWDGAEMYQMYIASKIIASGMRLLELEDSIIRKDIWVAGESVESYTNRPKVKIMWSSSVALPMQRLGDLVLDAVRPYVQSKREINKIMEQIWKQLYLYTYPYWILEYRRVQSWKYAFCLAKSMLPSKLLSNTEAVKTTKLKVWTLFISTTVCALSVPQILFRLAKPLLYKLAKNNRED